MKSNIVLPWGELEYQKVYLTIDKPVLFQCTFTDEPDLLWLGQHLEYIDASKWDRTSDEEINNYALTKVGEGIIEELEAGRYTLKKLFQEFPMLWVSHRFSKKANKHSTVYKDRTSINPLYEIADGATLSI